MSFSLSPAGHEFFRVQCRLNKLFGHRPAVFARMCIAHAKRLRLSRQVAFWQGVLAHETAESAQARADASDRIAGALMLSDNEDVREVAREQMRGFVSRGRAA